MVVCVYEMHPTLYIYYVMERNHKQQMAKH